MVLVNSLGFTVNYFGPRSFSFFCLLRQKLSREAAGRPLEPECPWDVSRQMKTGHQFSLRALRALHHKVSLWRHTFTWLFFTEQTSCVFRVEEKSFVMSVKMVNDHCTGGFHGCHQIFQITLTKRKGQCDMIKFFFLIFLFCFAHSETFSLIIEEKKFLNWIF